jgi:hypothetical protein
MEPGAGGSPGRGAPSGARGGWLAGLGVGSRLGRLDGGPGPGAAAAAGAPPAAASLSSLAARSLAFLAVSMRTSCVRFMRSPSTAAADASAPWGASNRGNVHVRIQRVDYKRAHGFKSLFCFG